MGSTPARPIMDKHITRFVVLTPGRSGSELLCRFIAAQPKIYMCPEIYHGSFLKQYSPTEVAQFRERPDIYLGRLQSGKSDVLVGSKVVFGEVDERTINKIIDDSNTAVILLYRRNLLRMAISSFLAGAIGQWHIFNERERVKLKNTIIVDPFDLHASMIHVEHQVRHVKKWLTTRGNTMTVLYEDLNKVSLEAVCAFLNLPKPASVVPTTIKQMTPEYYKAITNLSDIELKFRDKFGSLFDDRSPTIWK